MTDSPARNQPKAQYHQGQPILTAGEPISSAKAAMILVHGRGASAADILTLSSEFVQPGFKLGSAPYLGPILLDPKGTIQWVHEQHLLSEQMRELVFSEPALLTT